MIFVGNEGLEPPTLPMDIGMLRTDDRNAISGTFLDQPFHQKPVLPPFHLSFPRIGGRLCRKDLLIYQFPVLGLARKSAMLVKVLTKPVFETVAAVAEIVTIQGL